MKTLTHSESLTASQIMLTLQGNEEFPVEINVGSGVFRLYNEMDQDLFVLGMLCVLSAKEREGK